ncbi:MAG TPA: hypothetical protein VNF68_05700, partial [Candidatus Baltobacteraceae bacterium]|nr:hypothetical protein [Candidatus Baltobacteraceae bacterium]
ENSLAVWVSNGFAAPIASKRWGDGEAGEGRRDVGARAHLKGALFGGGALFVPWMAPPEEARSLARATLARAAAMIFDTGR